MTDFYKNFRTPLTRIPTSIFGMEFHQVAMYTFDLENSVQFISSLGFDEWIYDTAVLDGQYYGKECQISAQMAFNYQMLGGRELEFVSYQDHPDRQYRFDAEDHSSWRGPFLSHLSSYVDNIEDSVNRIEQKFGFEPYHRFETSQHTNLNVAGKKHFKEAIYDVRKVCGLRLKLIEKVQD